MKKVITITFIIISILSCKDKISSTNKSQREITFKELTSFKSKPDNEIEKFLKNNSFISLQTQFANQWKSESTNDIVQFNDKVVVFLTYNMETYNKLVNDLKKSTYKSTGKTIKKGIEVESFISDNETIFLNNMLDPSNSKMVYSLTFIK
ncbi:hypothetical protein [Flavobacterium sp. WC2430]|uniref:hypothetical protein n=1 Tax=Flavobacterium sp. WC2430 TaxID=3234137 RepID=UPI003464F8DA